MKPGTPVNSGHVFEQMREEETNLRMSDLRDVGCAVKCINGPRRTLALCFLLVQTAQGNEMRADIKRR
jgi:hypothetical protein